jgi:hypothetical protein
MGIIYFMLYPLHTKYNPVTSSILHFNSFDLFAALKLRYDSTRSKVTCILWNIVYNLIMGNEN